MSSLINEICHIFCCPPRPSHIVAKFAFLPPSPTYHLVKNDSTNNYTINFKAEAGFISDEAKRRLEPFYTISKRNRQIACLYIRYDPSINSRYSSGSDGYAANKSKDSKRFTILFSHGNAVDIGQMTGFLQSLAQRFQVNIMVYDYSGYGESTGQTLEENLYEDAEAAFKELNERFACPNERIVLYGQSIGTAPTVELAKNHQVAGVILHSALMSGIRVVCPGTNRRLCFDPFNNIAKVENINSPTLIMHGTDDEVIGINHGRELYARLPCPLEPLWVEGAGHNDIELFHEYVERLDKFFKHDILSYDSSHSPPSTDSPSLHSSVPVAQTENALRKDSFISADSSTASFNPIPSAGTNGRGSELFAFRNSTDSFHENNEDHVVHNRVSSVASLNSHINSSKMKPLSEVFHMSLKTKKRTPPKHLSHEILIESTNSNTSSVSLPAGANGEDARLWKKNTHL